MHKESEDSSPTFQQGWSNYGCSSGLLMIQRLLAEPFALHAHGVHSLMPFVVRKSAFQLLSNTQQRLTPSDKSADRCCISDKAVRGTETELLFEGGSLFCLVTDRTAQSSSSLRGNSSVGQSSATEQQIWFCTHKHPGFM